MKIKTKLFTIFTVLCLCFLSIFGTTMSFAKEIESTNNALHKVSTAQVENLSMTNFEGGVYFSGSYFADFPYEIYILGKNLSVSDSDVIEAFQKIDQILTRIDYLANTRNPDSDVTRFNELSYGQSISIANETAEMLKIAFEMFELTGGAFDPTAYRLVDLWGFSSRVQDYYYTPTLPYDRDWQYSSTDGYYIPLPDNKFVQAFKQLCNLQNVALSGNPTDGYTLTKQCQPVVVDGVTYEQWFDLGGIAKGFAIDLIKDVFAEYNFEHFFVNGATSSMAFSSFVDGTGLEIGLPTYGTISLLNGDLSSSGTYNKNYTLNGVTYSHIISPQTGRPVETGILLSTAFGDIGGGYAECLTTAMTVLGRDGIVNLMNTSFFRDNNIKASAIYDCEYTYNPFTGLNVTSGKILTNLSKDEFVEILEGFPIVTKIEADGTITLDEGLAEPPEESNTWLWYVCGAAALILFALCVFKFVKNSKAKKTEKIQQVKQDKFFKAPDIGIYSLLFLLILVLFSVFVFNAANPEGIEMVKIVDMTNGQVIWSFDATSGKYFSYDTDRFDISVEKSGTTLVVKLTPTDQNDHSMNQLTITKEDGGYSVKMTDAVCGLHRECVNNFPALKTNGGTIICTPNRIKVVTTRSQGNYII